mgnify:CR=1 FL=1|tara:strand:+ start:1270 stop:1965 length:696 start_codon:yes stop_codon:yes gene_type:complete
MIINSNFKDYYDPIAHQYKDEKVVYDRIERPYDHKKAGDTSFGAFVEKYSWGALEHSFKKGRQLTDKGECNLLLIGGKVYPFTNTPSEYGFGKAVEPTHQREWNFATPYAYYMEEVSGKNRSWMHNSQCEMLTTGERNDKAVEFCQRLAPVILIMGAYEWHTHLKHYRSRVILNPKLRSFHPPVSTWEIVQDLMGILGSVEPHIPEMNNQNKIDSHGYDKYSFRPNMKKGK